MAQADPAAVHRAALRARWWLGPAQLLLFLYLAPFLSEIVLTELGWIDVHLGRPTLMRTLWADALPLLLPFFLAARLLRAASGRRSVAALAWVSPAVLFALCLAWSGYGVFPEESRPLILMQGRIFRIAAFPGLLLATLAVLAPFLLAYRPVLGVFRPGSPLQQRFRRSARISIALLAAPLVAGLIGLFPVLIRGWVDFETAVRAGPFEIQEPLLVMTLLALGVGVPLAFTAWRCQVAMAALFPDPRRLTGEEVEGAYRQLERAMTVEAWDRLAPWRFQARGLAEGVFVVADVELYPEPSLVTLTLSVPGLPPELSIRKRGQEPPDVALADPVLGGALRVSGVTAEQAGALLEGLYDPLLPLAGESLDMRLAEGQLVVTLSGPCVLDERIREAARLAATLGERAAG